MSVIVPLESGSSIQISFESIICFALTMLSVLTALWRELYLKNFLINFYSFEKKLIAIGLLFSGDV